MPNIKTYENEDNKLTPSDLGYQAYMVSGRRIGVLRREGDQAIVQGIKGIGSAFDRREAQQEKAAAKADALQRRQAADQRRAAAEGRRVAAENRRAMKTADDALGHDEYVRLAPKFAELKARLKDGYEHIYETTPAADLPAALEKYRREVSEPAMEAFKGQVQSTKFRNWIDDQVVKAQGQYFTAQQADSAHARGQATVTAIGQLRETMVNGILKHPEDADKLRQDFHEAVQGIIAHTPDAGISGNESGNAVGARITSTLKARGWTDAAITGALNNGAGESGLSEWGKTGGAGEKGIWQFLPKNGTGHLDKFEQQAQGDHSVEAQTQYMANWVETHMPGYKDQTDNDTASRQFTKQFEAPSNANAKAEERLKYSDQSQAIVSGKGETATGIARSQNDKLQGIFVDADREAALAAIHGIAKGTDTRPPNPEAADELLRSGKYDNVLKRGDTEALTASNDAIRKKEALKTAHSAAQSYRDQQAASATAVADHLGQLHDAAGVYNEPKSWIDDVAKDPNLTQEDRKGLIDANNKLAERNKPNPDGTFSIPPKDNPTLVADLARAISKGPTERTMKSDPDAAGNTTMLPNNVALLNGLASGGISVSTAEMLARGLNPSSPTVLTDMADLDKHLTGAHDKLAPRNPDGSRNGPGEAAYAKYAENFMGRYHAGVNSGVPAKDIIASEDPNQIQRFAPTAQDHLAHARTQAGTPAAEVAADAAAEPGATPVPEMHGTGEPAPGPDGTIAPTPAAAPRISPYDTTIGPEPANEPPEQQIEEAVSPEDNE